MYNVTQEASLLYLNDPTHNNKIVKFKGRVVFLPTCISKGVVNIGDMNGRLLTLREFENRFGKYPRSVLNSKMLKNSLSKVFHKLHFQEQQVFKTRNLLVGQIGSKHFHKCLLSDFSLESPLCVGLWQRKLDLTVESKHLAWSSSKNDEIADL